MKNTTFNIVLHLCPSCWWVAFSTYTGIGSIAAMCFLLLCVLSHLFYPVTAILNFSCYGKSRRSRPYQEKQGLLKRLELKSLLWQRICVQQGRTAIFAPGSCTCYCSFIDCKEKKRPVRHFFPFSLYCICCCFLSHSMASSHCCSANVFGWNSYTKTEFTSAWLLEFFIEKSFKSFSFRKDWKWKLIETWLQWASETWKQTLIPSHLLDTVACIASLGWGWDNAIFILCHSQDTFTNSAYRPTF